MSIPHQDDANSLKRAHRAIYSRLALPQASANHAAMSEIAPHLDHVMIRLLVLKAGSRSQMPECQMVVAELQDHRYEALSYVWGDETKTEIITCCGQPLKVRYNLFTALRSLRDREFDRILWIDAICIDQENLQERGEQVSLMGRIYGAAQRVLVWLGEPHPEDSNAFDTIVELSRRIPPRRSKRWWLHKSSHVSRVEIDSYTGLSHLNFRQLLVFLSRSWFERVWVIQEVVRAKQAVVLCGKKELSWGDFAKIVLSLSDALSYLIEKHPDAPLNKVTAFENLAAMDSLKHDNEKMTLFAILCIASTFKSSDERDKLFALLNLGNRSSLRIKPDYTSHYFHVFRQHVVYELTRRHRLDYLARPPVGQQVDWPSWVPDWTEKSRSSYFYTAIGHSFCAAAETVPILAVEGNSLRIRGKMIDTVETLIAPMDHSRGRPNHLIAETIDSEGIIAWLEDCLSLVPLKLSLVPDAAASGLEPLLRTFACVGVHGPSERNSLFKRPNAYTTELKHSLEKLAAARDATSRFGADQNALLAAVTELASSLYPAITDRQFLRTSGLRRFGWVSKRARLGDVVCVLYGGAIPFVLRETEAGTWKVIGECYVDGLMQGQAMNMRSKPECDFHIC